MVIAVSIYLHVDAPQKFDSATFSVSCRHNTSAMV